MSEYRLRSEYLSVAEASNLHGYAPGGTALRQAARSGQIEYVKIAGRYLLKRASVDEYVRRERIRWSNLPQGARTAASAVS